MRVAFYTLGCKVNQNETASLEQLFQQNGYIIVAPGETADVFVVNSCTVTAEGEAKSRRWLHRAKRENPGAVTVLTGCFPQAFPERAKETAADVTTGTAHRSILPEQIARFLQTGERVFEVTPHSKNFEPLPVGGNTEKTRFFVKIQDGCNRRCAYCAIPSARGPARSRAEADIMSEIAQKTQAGAGEVVFTGINLSAYGRDTSSSLAALVDKTAAFPGVLRIRLGSLEPDLITTEDIARFAAQPKLCRHFHLSGQSGCDATLRRMRRPYTTAEFEVAAGALRSAMPGATLTTDIIVGFPGETDEEFAQTLAFVRRLSFLKVHVFPYSARPGTPAADFEAQVGAKTKAQRAKTLREAAEQARHALIAAQKGHTAFVLLEQKLPGGLFSGYTEAYFPVAAAVPGRRRGEIVKVVLGGFDGQRCLAAPIRQS